MFHQSPQSTGRLRVVALVAATVLLALGIALRQFVSSVSDYIDGFVCGAAMGLALVSLFLTYRRR